MTGIEAAIKVRDFLPACKIILFSGQATTVNLLGQRSGNGHQFEILASRSLHRSSWSALRSYPDTETLAPQGEHLDVLAPIQRQGSG